MRMVFSGSFDPITLGHMDIIRRGAAIADELIICIANNKSKSSRYDLEKRKLMVEKAISGLTNVRAEVFEGLLADYCRKIGADAILRGVRNGTDFEYERNMALINKCKLGVETVIMVSSPEMSYISSSVVRELKSFGGNADGLVPEEIIELL